jgi:UTP--glucose-1-phosphate uridylyltransferase
MTTISRLPEFISKMEQESLPAVVIDTFSHYYRQILAGADGLLSDKQINPLDPAVVKDFEQLSNFADAGRKVLPQAIKIVLNGGLGTSMGLMGPKSLLEVKDQFTFLDILLHQSKAAGTKLALMNSFSTQAATVSALSSLPAADLPYMFQQHKFPKVLQKDLSPARWPDNPALEWNPPGHGDIFIALFTSNLLDRLLAANIRYALIANSDNLGATLDESLLGYFADNELSFMMEVAPRTPADKKGGHLAQLNQGNFILRELAQCPSDEKVVFQDITRYRFFNTNNLWVDLTALNAMIKTDGFMHLPLILNPKTLDPRDAQSPPVYQIETAMGAAISVFAKAAAVKVPLERFHPVKKCNDLLGVRSDCYYFDNDHRLKLNPVCPMERIKVDLDPAFFGKIDQLDARFPAGVPSLSDCRSLKIVGDVRFEEGVVLKGDVIIENRRSAQAVIEKNALIEGALQFG